MKAVLLIITFVSLLLGAYSRDNTNEIINDDQTMLTWQDNNVVSIQTLNWNEAVDYCENLNLANYEDWRLPNINELRSIVDRTKEDPAINLVFMHIISGDFWSSTSGGPYLNNTAWGVDFLKGFGFGLGPADSKSSAAYVRCVRGGYIAPHTPPVMGDILNQIATQNINFSLDISTYVTLTNGDAVSQYTLTGTLPTGMSFNTTTGLLSGTASEAGMFDFSVTAADNDGISNSDSFTLTVEEMDNDGVTELPGVDGNHNGTEDRFEDNVASLPSGTDSITVSVQSSASIHTVSTSSTYMSGQRSDGTQIYFPYGTVSFTVSGLSNGGTANIELFYPYNENIEGYAKQLADGFWYDVGAIVTHNSADGYTKVTFSIVDGSSFDLDELVNGEVQDPGGAYSLTLSASNTVTVPLSASAKAVLALLFVFAALLFMRKEKWINS